MNSLDHLQKLEYSWDHSFASVWIHYVFPSVFITATSLVFGTPEENAQYGMLIAKWILGKLKNQLTMI